MSKSRQKLIKNFVGWPQLDLSQNKFTNPQSQPGPAKACDNINLQCSKLNFFLSRFLATICYKKVAKYQMLVAKTKQ